MATLASDGGTKTRTVPWPARHLFGEAEKAAAVNLFEQSISSGNAFGYNGPPEEEYRRRFAEYLGGGLAHTVNSGTSAVLAAVAGLGLEPFSEVVVPPITDPGGVMPVALLNLIPVVADATPGSYNLGAAQVEAVLTERTRAILVAHIAGEPVDLDPILELARRHNLKVVEDCAQSHGATYHGQLVGTLGDIAAFSTMSGKHHATGAQGGVVYSRHEEYFWRARRFADRGKPFNTDSPTNVTAGLNLNLNDLSAAIGLVQLDRLPDMVARRQAVGEAVREGLAKVDGVGLGWQAPNSQSAYWFLRVFVDPNAFTVDMATFIKAVSAEGIPVGWPYATVTPEGRWFQEQHVFGTPGMPWSAAEYRGERRPTYPCPIAHESRHTHFNVGVHENCGPAEAADVVAAVSKVAAAFRR
ncbi:MAG: DegT/DnrJ/EryC1/StrS family aminotransferase [Armatimonadetes bacterium]|nr:DegT/DnrJ/EryC1/StrS family aminotransferase [Armatimonadota bacterium]